MIKIVTSLEKFCGQPEIMNSYITAVARYMVLLCDNLSLSVITDIYVEVIHQKINNYGGYTFVRMNIPQ